MATTAPSCTYKPGEGKQAGDVGGMLDGRACLLGGQCAALAGRHATLPLWPSHAPPFLTTYKLHLPAPLTVLAVVMATLSGTSALAR